MTTGRPWGLRLVWAMFRLSPGGTDCLRDLGVDAEVKCDEARPACGQCVRLGHECDYNPRLSFRDDTPRIVERMQDVSVIGNTVWANPPSHTSTAYIRSAEDLLPPFQLLTTDEEREKKAELYQPGTYHVIANQESFESLPEYRDGGTSMVGSRRGLLQSSNHRSEVGYDVPQRGPRDGHDPNVVILRSFEDVPRRASLQSSYISVARPSSPSHSLTRHSPRRHSSDLHGMASSISSERHERRDAILLEHYRRIISPKLFRRELDDGEEDVFEKEARTHPPVFHAITALAQLTVSGVHTADALEHYQQVIPALQSIVQSSQDSYSDGAFFTHFLLLLYEIAAALHGDASMAQHHNDQLLRIIRLRRQANGAEPYEFLVWCIAVIDIYSLLSMGGSGVFTETLIKENLVPPPERCLASDIPVSSQEQLYLPLLRKIYKEIHLLLFRVAQEARVMRVESTQRQISAPGMADSESTNTRRGRVQNLLNLINQSYSTWIMQFPGLWRLPTKSEPTSPRVFYCIQQIFLLYRTCILYAHTSMFPNQSNNPMPAYDQIFTVAREIIEAVAVVLSEKRDQVRTVMLPLFIAGFTSKDQTEKQMVLDLLLAIETQDYRGSTDRARRVLERLYEKQRLATMELKNPNSVDWTEEVQRSGNIFII
ncbi:uncharacterized protein LY89DRAFT_728652 [Mollisia scopiformis]|uniref:Zn(2)-C6 fungal-type domain-containing protein n=1 Tax=Mollisia scopiformis TaxID=149040 RepID=A0A194XQP4_MOLSC|nr:uncharacterized protein LY89DRAFT_728652 [Mollisia scopiformis]KUJ22518.1 hypothetical protein LY89DRAFT_728652 [Mollisia scopiformis]